MITKEINFNIDKILSLLPHRYPILLVDKVLEINPKKSIKALKNVSINEQFFIGHFYENPIMPGVLIIEALAQATAILILYNKISKIFCYFVGIDKARFRKIVKPGDQIILNITFNKSLSNIYKFKSYAKVNNIIVAQATLIYLIKNNHFL